MEFIKSVLDFYITLITSTSKEFYFFILLFVGVITVSVVSKIFSFILKGSY